MAALFLRKIITVYWNMISEQDQQNGFSLLFSIHS